MIENGIWDKCNLWQMIIWTHKNYDKKRNLEKQVIMPNDHS